MADTSGEIGSVHLFSTSSSVVSQQQRDDTRMFSFFYLLTSCLNFGNYCIRWYVWQFCPDHKRPDFRLFDAPWRYLFK